MRRLIVILALALAACKGSDPAPVPPPPPMPVSGDVPASAYWNIVDYTPVPNPPILRPLVRTSRGWEFDFIQGAWTPGYVETPLAASIAGAKSITIEYAIEGDSSVFADEPHVALLLHHKGDTALAIETYRQYGPTQPLVVGPYQMTVELRQENWINVNGQKAGLVDTMANLASVGFVLGAGAFRSHGVTLQGGSAKFILQRYSIDRS